LTYHKDNFLSLQLQYKKEDEWIECFNIPNVTLPTVTYLGFSAHTGEVSGLPSYPICNSTTGLTWVDFHDILQVETKTIYKSGGISSSWKNQANGAAEGGKKGKPKSQPLRKARKSDSFVMGFARVLAVLVIMLIAYFVYTAWRATHGHEGEYGRRYRRY
jgi:mannose-binding lectin 2